MQTELAVSNFEYLVYSFYVKYLQNIDSKATAKDM